MSWFPCLLLREPHCCHTYSLLLRNLRLLGSRRRGSGAPRAGGAARSLLQYGLRREWRRDRLWRLLLCLGSEARGGVGEDGPTPGS